MGQHQNASAQGLTFDSDLAQVADEKLQRGRTPLRLVDVFEDLGIIEVELSEQVEPEFPLGSCIGTNMFPQVCRDLIQGDEALAEPVFVLAHRLPKRRLAAGSMWLGQWNSPSNREVSWFINLSFRPVVEFAQPFDRPSVETASCARTDRIGGRTANQPIGNAFVRLRNV